MPNNKMSRKTFFQSIAGEEEKTLEITGESDPLFQTYARKSLGPRTYTPYKEYLDAVNTQMNGGQSTEGPKTMARVGNVTSGLASYTGTWGEAEAIHLLRRAHFGNRKSEVDMIVNLGNASTAVDALMSYGSTPSSPTPTPINMYDHLVSDPNVNLGQSWVQNNLAYHSGQVNVDQHINQRRTQSIKYHQWGVWLEDDLSLREKLTLFWYHFIPVDVQNLKQQVKNSATMAADYISLLRSHSKGNLKTLILEITKQPAMLFYLSNHFSTATAPNENYARELLELFLVGKNPQNYIEQDVQQGAKVLSGWRLLSNPKDPYPHITGFKPSRHNTSNKTFSSYFGSETIVGATGANGAAELGEYFDMIFDHQKVAISEYICRRLYRFFVYYDIDSNINNNVIIPLAALLRSQNWEMEPVIKTLFKSEHFYDMANRGVMIKSPFDLVVGAFRTLECDLSATSTNPNIHYNQYWIWRYMENMCSVGLGQSSLEVPSVAGWSSYYQAPTYYQNWITSTTMQNRAKFIDQFLQGKTIRSTHIRFDGLSFIQQFPSGSISNPNFVVDTFITYLLPMDLPSALKTQIKQQTLLSGQTQDYYWTDAWTNFMANPGNAAYANSVKNKIKSLLSKLLHLAEAQLM